MKSKLTGLTALLAAIALLVSACGGKDGQPGKTGEPQPAPEVKKDPFTLSVFGFGVKEEEFNDRFRTHLEKSSLTLRSNIYPPTRATRCPNLCRAAKRPTSSGPTCRT
ncbi:hypothetical protein [Paenibacillus oceani]|uniref:Uncharacterized protein n=1 Tax=Paenibacillus oceani TaxID=2772510 RepID=A0A927CFP0_9BACL|nr:hypothetical protein [Paenibacillus oceani]MBD2866700.1 hypothetical protein [Paenibacillus oceani]